MTAACATFKPDVWWIAPHKRILVLQQTVACQIGRGGYMCVLPVVKILKCNSKWPPGIFVEMAERKFKNDLLWCWPEGFLFVCHKLHLNQEVMLFTGVRWRVCWQFAGKQRQLLAFMFDHTYGSRYFVSKTTGFYSIFQRDLHHFILDYHTQI